MKLRGVFVFLALFLLGCGTSLQSVDASRRTRTFNADYLSTFNAVLAFCSQNGYNASYADKNSGVINTNYKRLSTNYALVFEQRMRVTFYVRAISASQTMVTATLALEYYVTRYETWETREMSADEAEGIYERVLSSVQSCLATAKK
jgi:hypothetical protein